MRCFLIVLDSVGIGEAPDAGAYDDEGANTLAHLAEAAGGLHVPVMQSMGLGNIPALLPTGIPIQGVAPTSAPRAAYGAMQELSQGKGTTTGHWEMAGLLLDEGFSLFPSGPPSFPPEILEPFQARTGRSVLGNCAASGTKIIQALGLQQREQGSWIVYTSGDSVLQIAAHEDVIPVEELYRACDVARELCNAYRVGRVIARPFVGAGPGTYTRTDNRRDYCLPLPELTLLDLLKQYGHDVVTVGKLDDIFNHRGMTRVEHAENTPDAQEALLSLVRELAAGFVFANFIDFDMHFGHRRDPQGYARALEETDRFLGSFLALLRPNDVLMITADHGNDPTFRGTDHTREYVPLLVAGNQQVPTSLGIREGFFDVAQSVASLFGIPALARGVSFL